MKVREVIAFKDYFEKFLLEQPNKVQLNGFQEKTQKTPKNEIQKGLRLMTEYYKPKNKKNGD